MIPPSHYVCNFQEIPSILISIPYFFANCKNQNEKIDAANPRIFQLPAVKLKSGKKKRDAAIVFQSQRLFYNKLFYLSIISFDHRNAPRPVLEKRTQPRLNSKLTQTARITRANCLSLLPSGPGEVHSATSCEARGQHLEQNRILSASSLQQAFDPAMRSGNRVPQIPRLARCIL